ncbi:MAG: DNA repair protein RadA [Fibrobacterota bacterium]
MAKKGLSYVCTECGENLIKWMGRCPSCGAFNTVKEYRAPRSKKTSGRRGTFQADSPGHGELKKLRDYSREEPLKRLTTGFPEVDTVLGGGIVPGEICLIGGNPGIGKSTLLLQIAAHLSRAGRKVLYVSGEESLEQISLRARRVHALECDMDVLAETSTDRVIDLMRSERPDFLIVDSVQTLYLDDIASAPGSVSQVRESTALLTRSAKDYGVSVFIIGHVTKEGTIAGPRILEHMVDAVLSFEGDSNYSYRLLRGIKNRFGPSGEIALLGMEAQGLTELAQGAKFFINQASLEKPGTAVVPVLEGSRVLMVEVQALVTESYFGLPQRVAAGVNQKKLALIVAVLEKYAGISLGGYDIFANITGGFNINEPAVDLALAAALVSSFRNTPVPGDISFVGELGLSGELRTVADMDKRLKEAAALGFTRVVCPPLTQKKGSTARGDERIPCRDIRDVVDRIL